ncbi:MAG: protein-glutamate O-methyltransferase CheR [Candidatus Sabulitectum sp.]|nr:protein-glutamate O-methyltransferase CheR [Candidatus Sabulitectum sp.]
MSLRAENAEISNENLEINLLIEAVRKKYGYDFSGYSRASLKRRIKKTLNESYSTSISGMIHRIIYEKEFFDRLLLDLSVNVTEMFRDPLFFKAIKEEVLPVLAKQSSIKIWHAGCSTGEEVYSMAILLKEADIYNKSQIFATDFNEVVLSKARQGIFPIGNLRESTRNYQKSGGTGAFTDWYTAKYDFAMIKSTLRKNILFADHNLVTDGVFSEVDLVICRNVLIYFERSLQNRVFRLFSDSISTGGFLAIGSKESIHFSNITDEFEQFSPAHKIFRKRK